MRTEFVSFLTTDKLELPGLLYSPTSNTRKAAIWLHGMGDNGVLYNPYRVNVLGDKLTQQGITLFAFNNRGAHQKKTLKIRDETLPEDERRYQAGTHFELIADCVKDIDGAVSYLQSMGYREFYLMGHSSGANKICVYNHLQPQNPFSRFVLTGAGDDNGLWYTGLGDRKFWHTLAQAQQYVHSAKGHHIMPAYSGMRGFSAQSAADLLDPDGLYNSFPFYESLKGRLGKKPLFEEYRQLARPLLLVYGENDEACATAGGSINALKILKQHTNPSVVADSTFTIIPDTDHGFAGKELELATLIADWLGGKSS